MPCGRAKTNDNGEYECTPVPKGLRYKAFGAYRGEVSKKNPVFFDTIDSNSDYVEVEDIFLKKQEEWNYDPP